MIKKNNLLRQKHYVAPAFESLVVDATSAICAVSPTFGGPNEAGSDVDLEQSFDF